MKLSFSETRIKDIMTTTITACRRSDGVMAAAKLMMEKDFNGLPVVEGESKLVGMLSHKELLDSRGEYLPAVISVMGGLRITHSGDVPEVTKKLLTLKRLVVESLMNRDYHYLDPEAPLEKAAEAFMLWHEDPLPVVDSSKNLVGILSKYDLLKVFAESVHPIAAKTGLIMEKEELNVGADLQRSFVVVSRGRARFWYMGLLVFLAIGVIVALSFVIRIKIL